MATSQISSSATGRVLIASPNGARRKRATTMFGLRGLKTVEVSGGAEALLQLESGRYDSVMVERWLPDLQLDDFLFGVRQRDPEVPVLFLDEDADQGNEQSKAAAEAALVRDLDCEENDVVEVLPGVVGASVAMKEVGDMVRLAARRDVTVLLMGKSGTGKEVIARALHRSSRRAGHPFAVLNCAAIPETLFESELFGYSKGAFTGAVQSQSGRAQAAQGGTLFLDEIGEAPLSVQAKLLRFVQEREIQRLGSSDSFRVDVRIVAATNAKLLKLVKEGRFREDLYYRLSAFPILLPALADRKDDILPLAKRFLAENRQKYRCTPRSFSSAAAQKLLSHGWPGNVRELQHVIERAMILADDNQTIEAKHVLLPDVDDASEDS